MLNVKEIFTKKNSGRIIAGLIVISVIVYVVWYYTNKTENFSALEDAFKTIFSDKKQTEAQDVLLDPNGEVESEPEQPEQPEMPVPMGSNFKGSPLENIDQYKTRDITPEDLLPSSEVADQFADQFPVGTGDLSAKNFLTAGFHTGINTVSNSLRNANRQVRSDPYIPVQEVGPWGQSTMLPDLNRKDFEIGSA